MNGTDLDVVREFTRALPRHLAQQLNVTDRVTAYIHAAIRDHQWTVPLLIEECCRDTQGIYRPGGLITHRLERCAQAPPAVTATAAARPFCGDCDNGLIYHVPDDPTQDVTAIRCPCRGTT